MINRTARPFMQREQMKAWCILERSRQEGIMICKSMEGTKKRWWEGRMRKRREDGSFVERKGGAEKGWRRRNGAGLNSFEDITAVTLWQEFKGGTPIPCMLINIMSPDAHTTICRYYYKGKKYFWSNCKVVTCCQFRDPYIYIYIGKGYTSHCSFI